METILLATTVILAAAVAGWFYWQTQKTEQRITEVAARLAAQSTLVGEMVDEVVAASQNLYHEMDRWQGVVDGKLSRRAEMIAAPLVAPSTPDEEERMDEAQAGIDGEYSPHLHALKMSKEGIAPVEIARYTGIGLEELRLLLRFQEKSDATRDL